MSIKALEEYTRVAKYARYNEEKGRRENWREQIERVISQHARHLESFVGDKFSAPRGDGESDEPTLFSYLAEAEEALLEKTVLGSQRILQFGGEGVLKKNARAYNCCASYCDRARFFQEAMWLLLCGCGVGFSVQSHHVARLPKIAGRAATLAPLVYAPEDTIEGWADAVGILVSSFIRPGEKGCPFPEYQGRVISFDFSQIRPAGAPISHGGKAPGPKGLEIALGKIAAIFERRLAGGENKLRPIDAYDIVMHSSDAVLSGGVRRSATIAIFSPWDDEMMEAKTGNWFTTNPQRGRSNNSALLVRGDVPREQFNELLRRTREFGEPGFVWADNTEVMYNPCVEIALYCYDDLGRSGWAFCNLCEINMKKVRNEADFFKACRAASILGTVQATYTSFPYLGEVSERIARLEALLGVSMTGMMDSPEVAFSPEVQRRGAEIVREVNGAVARLLGINPAARATCVKPAGSTSCILGSSSGIHPHHATRYFRNVQANKMEPTLQWFEQINPGAVEESVWSANSTDKVITFLCEVPKGAITKNRLSAVELLEKVVLTKQNWVEAGTNPDQPYKFMRHNVSNTITVREDEWAEVEEFIWQHKEDLAGVSLLPASGDKDYPQAPFTAVFTPAEIVEEYGDGSLMASGLIVRALKHFKNNLWEACDAALGLHDEAKLTESQRLWVGRAKQFADRYCEGNIKRCTYLMKDVHNWKRWCDLRREYIDVDWDKFYEKKFSRAMEAGEACSGGKCDIVRM